jgi:simple sugar transport system permease protein
MGAPLSEALAILLSDQFWAAALRIATPLIFGALGALLCERAGVLNLGIEGIFVAGAFAGWMAVFLGAGLGGGVVAAALTGAAFGALHGLMTVKLGLSQHVSGLGITLLASSSAYFAYRTALPNVATPPRVEPFRALDLPVLSDLPFLGVALFQQTALTWAALALVPALWWLLNRTALGVAIRAVGDNPDAVDAQGLSVTGLRMGAVMAGSALMGVGGAFLTLSAFDAFFFGMIGGRGWICIAIVIFASWRPEKALLGALLFGAFDAWQLRMQTTAGGVAPGQLFLMAPYVLSILALVVAARRADYPRALLKPWVKGER